LARELIQRRAQVLSGDLEAELALLGNQLSGAEETYATGCHKTSQDGGVPGPTRNHD
jgi:hypothetical protein